MFKELDIILIIKAIIIALLAYLTPLQPLILAIGVLILFDTIVGIYKAWKLNEKISSRRFGHIISKFALYNIAIISGYILENMIGLDNIPIARIIAVGIGLTELLSISENIDELTGINIYKLIRLALKRGADTTSQVVSESLDEGHNLDK